MILADTSFINVFGYRQSTNELIRLNLDGSRDSSINQAGLRASIINIPGQNGLLIQPDGKYLILGHALKYNILVVARLEPDGSFEKQAGPFGDVTNRDTFALQPDGKILLTGGYSLLDSDNPLLYGDQTFAAFRLTATLYPDPSFGVVGVSTPISARQTFTKSGVAQYPYAQAIAVDAQDRAIVVGSLYAYPHPVTSLIVARLTASTTPDRAFPGDYSGDRVADPAVYLPDNGAFAIGDSSGGTTGQVALFGPTGPGRLIPAPGDYNGSLREEVGGYLPDLGVYAYRPANGGPDVAVPFGTPGPGQSIPVPADYYETGRDDIAVYLAAAGAFAIQDPTGQTAGRLIPFGEPGLGQSIPVPGDYDGSGHLELAVYVPSVGAFFYRPYGGGPDVAIPFGTPGPGRSLPVPGDYDGSGHTEVAVYLPSLGIFAYRPANQAADVYQAFGLPGDGQTLPAPGDYTGSGRTELGAYLPAYGLFAYRPTVGPDVVEPFGTPGPGRTIPVTSVVLSPFPGSNPGSGGSFAMANFVDGFDPVETSNTKRKPAGSTG